MADHRVQDFLLLAPVEGVERLPAPPDGIPDVSVSGLALAKLLADVLRGACRGPEARLRP
jgi:hypothetical protein